MMGSDDGDVVDHNSHVGHGQGFRLARRCLGTDGAAGVVGVEDGGGAGVQAAGDCEGQGVGEGERGGGGGCGGGEAEGGCFGGGDWGWE